MNDKVAIVGSGLVGRAWAISFARGGHDVVLFDTDDKAVANALRTVEGLLTKLELAGMLKGQTAVEVRSRINGAPSLEAALAGAAHVQENAPEELEVKREIFAKLDAAAERNAVLASSSSGILPSRISDELAGKSRCLASRIRSILLTSSPQSRSCRRRGPIRKSWSARANGWRRLVRRRL